MAGIVYHLPTWNTWITPWRFDIATRTRTMGTQFKGQMYPPIRTSDNEGASDGYLVYPKTNDVFRDPKEFNQAGTDAFTFAWNGKTWGYVVEQVLPRWMNFPNEHLLAIVRRMTQAELVLIAGPVAPPDDGSSIPVFDTAAEVYRVVDGVAGNTHTTTVEGRFLGSWQLDDQVIASSFDFGTSDYDSITPSLLLPFSPQEFDIIEIEVPAGSAKTRFWYCVDTVDQNYGTENEFVRAILLPITLAEKTLWFGGPPDTGLSTITASPAFVANDGSAFATISGVMLDSLSNPIVGATVAVTSSTGNASISGTAFTDSSGAWSVTATDTTAETTTFSADCNGVTVGPSNSVEYGSYPPSFDMDSTITTGNGTCSNCVDLNGGINCLPDIPGETYISAPFALTCVSGQGQAQWLITFATSGGHRTVTLQLVEYPVATAIANWVNSNIDSWDGVSPISVPFSFDFSGGTCLWNDPISITPGP